MELVSEHVHRALAYVRLLNDHGVAPTRTHLDAFARNPGPLGAEYESKLLAGTAAFAALAVTKVRDAEPVVDYLLRMDWVELSAAPGDKVSITELGRVLLRGLEAEGPVELPTPTVTDVALEPADPLAWVHLTRIAAHAGEGMLVDAYFRAEFVPWLVETTTIRRVLISRRAQSANDLGRMAVALGTVPNAGTLEVRTTNSAELHDRCLLRADGKVQLLGSSVNGVGKNLTAVITPDNDVMRVYRERYENLWETAAVIAPQTPGSAPQPGAVIAGP